ncbi:MAG TPA: hypothetical protein ENJ54_10220 [Chloroflexi bacterium]|nr:hypothetical protein [Chloroflexota bacterium]
MCTFFSFVLDVLAALGVVLFGWFGRLFLFQPARYLRAFASLRLENFQRWGLSEEEIARRPPAVLMRWLTRKPYRQWLESLAREPERHRALLVLVRLYGVGLAVVGLAMLAALLLTLPVQVRACF